MAASSVTYFLKSLHAKANKEIEKGTEIFFSASVVNNNKSHKLLDMEPVDTMTKQINHMVKTEKPEIIIFFLFLKPALNKGIDFSFTKSLEILTFGNA